MPKKNSSKLPAQLKENLVMSEEKPEKPSSTGKKSSNEIDGIFSATKKKKQQEKGKKKKPIEDASGRPKKKNKSPVVSEEKPSSTGKKSSNEIDESATGKKRSSNEIDEIFSAMKKKKQEQEKEEDKKPIEDVSGRPKKMSKKKSKEDANGPSSSSRPKKRTNEGFTIYTEEELGLGKADAGDALGGEKKEEDKMGEARTSGYGFPANIQISPPTTHALGGPGHANTSPFLHVRLAVTVTPSRGAVRGSFSRPAGQATPGTGPPK